MREEEKEKEEEEEEEEETDGAGEWKGIIDGFSIHSNLFIKMSGLITS